MRVSLGAEYDFRPDMQTGGQYLGIAGIEAASPARGML